ncbi:MAG: HD domain-containing protein [Bacilli bacterium]|nr:HD domain-containing protein [Bacilli bacterium]
MKKKMRFTIRAKLMILSSITIAVAVMSLAIFLTISFDQSAYESASQTLQNTSSNAFLALENSISSVETSMNLLANQIGYNVDFANSITTISEDQNSYETIIESLQGKDKSGDGSTIIGAMDYLIVSDPDIESATMYSQYVHEDILERLKPVNESKIAYTAERFAELKKHPGKSMWFFTENGKEEYLYVWKALVNYGVRDNYDMEVVGYIEYGFNRKSFLSCISDTKYENEGMALFDESGKNILLLESGDKNADEAFIKDYSSLNKEVERKSNYTVCKNKLDSKNREYYTYINHNALSEMRTKNAITTAIIITIAVVSATLISFLLSAGEIKRIKETSKAALAISDGDYSVRVKVKGNDELTDQTNAMNLMAGNIESLISELKDLNKMLVLQSDLLTENFATVVSNKSGESGYHVRRVATYSEILARTLGFSEDKVHSIKVAATLHDIGKIMIADSVLHKPGRFTDEEREIMQHHVDYGAQILANVPGEIMEMGKKIALYHHERWDGNGYIYHLKGDEIPIEAQICSVADVFDALISRRCYKEPWNINQAYDEIVKNSGTQFSPRVVDAFIKSYKEIEEVALMYLEKEKEAEAAH